MTRDEELAALIVEQKRDDSRIVQPQRDPTTRMNTLSLDTNASDDPFMEWGAGVTYDFEEMIETGDYHHPGQILSPRELDPKGRHGGGSSLLRQIEHGTYNGYHNQGCRCELCRKAHTEKIVGYQRKARKLEQNARPDRICANEKCRKPFRPIPSTKMHCSQRCTNAAVMRRARANETPEQTEARRARDRQYKRNKKATLSAA